MRGVIASDAANNSVDGGVLIPTVVFGIPGSGGMAIVLAILILTGITPGPLMLTRHLDLTVSMVYTIAFANLVVVPIMLAFAPTLCRISVIPPNILAPVVVGIVSLAALAAAGNLGDLGCGAGLRPAGRLHEAIRLAASAHPHRGGAGGHTGAVPVDSRSATTAGACSCGRSSWPSWHSWSR